MNRAIERQHGGIRAHWAKPGQDVYVMNDGCLVSCISSVMFEQPLRTGHTDAEHRYTSDTTDLRESGYVEIDPLFE